MTMNGGSAGNTLWQFKDGSTESRAVETYYDDWAETYDETLAGWQYHAPQDSVELLAPHLAPGARILDLGCGTGLLAEALRAEGDYSIDGIDISAVSLQLAERRGGYARLIRHDLQKLPLPVEENAYDAAASVGVLTYIDKVEPLLRDLCRCVRSGGVLTFTQRTDRWEDRGFPEMLARLEGEGLLTVLQVTEPKLYLPGNPDFGEDIQVRHSLCRVA